MQFPRQQKPLQVLPQVPQFAKSSILFTHAPAQQDWPDGQGTPHSLQFAESVCRFLHTPLQHVSPAAHIVSQSPQCVVSHTLSQQRPSQQVPSQHVCAAVQQVPLQPVCPAGQQAPSEHVSPAAHAFPQLPQWFIFELNVISLQVPQFVGVLAVQTLLQEY